MPKAVRTLSTNDAAEITRQEHNKLVADVAALRTKFVSLLAKLDADAGVTDANYAASQTPAAMTADTDGVTLY
jgi:hypothetical protein